MKSLLPFAWDRLNPSARRELDARREEFLCVPFLQPGFLSLKQPAAPSYWLFTSQNGVRGLMHQEWFQAGAFTRPAYCVGEKTAELARKQGFRVLNLIPPPAPQILEHLPQEPGLWVCGQAQAHDLTKMMEKGRLSALLTYEMRADLALQTEIKVALEKNQIRSMFVTSLRVGRELDRLITAVRSDHPDAGLQIDSLVFLSERLAGNMPSLEGQSLQIQTVPDLETGVRLL